MTALTWRKLAATALLDQPAFAMDWDRLNAGLLDLPFLSASAVGAAIGVFAGAQERLLVGSVNGRVVAMLVLVPEGGLRWRTFQPSQLPLGAWVAEQGVALNEVCRSLLRGPLGFCVALSITQIDPLMYERGADDATSTHADYIDTAWLDIAGTFDDYWATRGKNLRQNMRKQRNRLAAAGTATQLRVWRGADDMAPALARYGALESAGWKAGRGTAIHADNDQGRFYTRLFEDAAARGEAVVYEYLFDDKPVALNLCLLRSAVLVVLKTTYDERIPNTLSPAFLLREEELRQFFADGEVRRIEYFGKVMDWHTKLTAQRRTLYHLTTYRWPLVKSFAQRRRAAASAPCADAATTAETPARTALPEF